MPRTREDLQAHLLSMFRIEAGEHLGVIAAGLATLDRATTRPEVDQAAETVFRAMHTLKGAARAVGLRDVETICQAVEAVLSRIRRGELPLTPVILPELGAAVDGVAGLLSRRPVSIRDLVDRLERVARRDAAVAPVAPRAIVESPIAAGPAQASARREPGGGEPPHPHGPLPRADTIRLEISRVDRLLVQAEDLLGARLAAAERVREARAMLDTLRRCRELTARERWFSKPASTPPAAREAVEATDAELRAAERRARTHLGQLARDHRTLAQTVDGLQQEIRQLRLVSATSVLDPLPPMVHDLAGQQGKEVDCDIHGEDLAVDRRVLEAMKDPLIHLVRNAIDHGIEPPEARRQAGKSARGRITVTLTALEGGRIEILVTDDGRGIDVGRVRAMAVRQGLLADEEARQLDDEAASRLVYHSGLSTSPAVSDLSGHGLGLAIVKERVDQLDGAIDLDTRPAAGTTVRMVLPATIATFRGVMVRVGDRRFLLSTEVIERALRVAPGQARRIEGREAIRLDSRVVPLVALGSLLGLPVPEETAGRRRPCLVVSAGSARQALLVDDVLGVEEALVKPLRPPLVRVRHVAAAGILGTGELILILRPADLLRAASLAGDRPVPVPVTPGPRRQPSVLVVDDSITTRAMEKGLLEAAGYRVRVAVDGMDAWTALQTEPVDLVVSDVQMPGMDGFELTARIRADRRLADLPVVLVTALESPEDRERGLAAGASAYIIKSSFEPSGLLDTIRRLA